MRIEDLWDERHFQLAMKSDKPMEAYSEIRSNVRSLKDTPTIDELPPEEQAWFRSS